MTPYICAGDNLNFFPAGPLFRRSGAFFIRRAFDESTLYPTVLRRYLKSLVNSRVVQEVFVEGGRSRTGRMRAPMMGIMSMMAKSYFSGDCKDLTFVPVSISYDRVPEERAYVREIRGEHKRAEGLSDLARIWRMRRMPLGRAYMDIGAPISMHDFLKGEGFDVAAAHEHAKRKATTRLAQHACKALQERLWVTPTALLATVLFAQSGDRTEQGCLDQAAQIGRLFEAGNVPVFSRAEGFEDGMRRAFTLFRDAGVLDTSVSEATVRVKWQDPNVPFLLDYYRAGATHALAPFAIWAAVRLSDSAVAPEERAQHLEGLLAHDFPLGFAVTSEQARQATETLDRETLLALRSGIVSLLEAQHRTVETLYAWLKGDLPWLKRVEEDVLVRYVLKTMRASAPAEARHYFTVTNAVHLAAEQRLVVLHTERHGRHLQRTVELNDAASFENLDQWLSRLSEALRAA